MEWSNLGSATHYSYSCLDNFMWEAELPMCSLCMSVLNCMCCLFGTRRYPPTHPTGDNMLVVLSTALLHWAQANFNINFRWGFEQVFVFNYWMHILSVNSIWTVCEFNNEMCFWENFRGSYKNIRKTFEYQSNAETFDHLALLAMLSALRHRWGILALFLWEVRT